MRLNIDRQRLASGVGPGLGTGLGPGLESGREQPARHCIGRAETITVDSGIVPQTVPCHDNYST